MLWPHYGWSMRQALALLLVPDIPLTDKKTVKKVYTLTFPYWWKTVKKSLYLNFTLTLLTLYFNLL